MLMKKKVVVSWRCENLNKIIKASDEAVFHIESGWICDCGDWVKGTDNCHVALKYGSRLVYDGG